MLIIFILFKKTILTATNKLRRRYCFCPIQGDLSNWLYLCVTSSSTTIFLRMVLLKLTSATQYQGIWCARSGSSFLGSLLSTLPTATYFFEPFYSGGAGDRARDILLDIFSCDNRTIKDLHRSVSA